MALAPSVVVTRQLPGWFFMTERYRPSRTLTVGQLLNELSLLDPSLPVVFEARDEPLGDYGVRSLEVCEMQRETIFADGPFGCDVFHSHCSGGHGDCPKEWWSDRHSGDRYDPPQEVVMLRYESEWKPTIDGEIAQPELPVGGSSD